MMLANGNMTLPLAVDAAAANDALLAMAFPFGILWLFLTPVIMFVILRHGRAKLESVGLRALPRTSFFAVLAQVLFLVIEFMQMTWFTFHVNVGQWDAAVLEKYFGWSLFVVPSVPWALWFWVLAGYGAFFITAVVMMARFKRPRFFTLAIGLTLGLALLFQPMMLRMMQALSCAYFDDGSSALQMMPEMECWTGAHIAYVMVAVFIIAVVFPLFAFGHALLSFPKGDVATWCAFLCVQLKMLQVIVHLLLPAYPVAQLSIFLLVGLTLFSTSLTRPCDTWLANLVRSTLALMCAWAAAAALAQLKAAQENSDLAFALLLGGWCGSAGACIALYWIWFKSAGRRAREELLKDASESEEQYEMAAPAAISRPAPAVPPYYTPPQQQPPVYIVDSVADAWAAGVAKD